MTDPDFRALCAEAAEHLSLLDDPPHQLVIAMQEALAQPAPEPPTDDQLDVAVIAIQALVMPKGDSDLQLSAVDEGRKILCKAIARWGQGNG